MKKRKNVILSAITCFVSICLLMIGVYAASSPSVSIGGQVSYTARDASVLVQGKTSKDGSSLVFDSVPSTKDFSGLTEKTSGESYLDWTVGEGHDVAGDQLKAWTVGDLSFAEDSSGIKPIKLGFSFTNYSNFPVEATIVLNTSTLTSTTNVELVQKSEIENGKITRTITLAKGETKTSEFDYKIIDDSKDASGAKIDVNVDFANANAPKPKKTVVNTSFSDDLSDMPDYESRSIYCQVKLKNKDTYERTISLADGTGLVDESVNLPYDNAEIQEIKIYYSLCCAGPGMGVEEYYESLSFTGDGLVSTCDSATADDYNGVKGYERKEEYTLTNIPAEFTITC